LKKLGSNDFIGGKLSLVFK